MVKTLIFLTVLFLAPVVYAAPDLSVSSTSGAPGSSVSVYVVADFSQAVNSMQFNLQFDPKLLTPLSVTAGSADSSWVMVSNLNNPGTALVGMFNSGGVASEVSGSQQQIAIVKFTVNNPPGDAATTSALTPSNASFDSTCIGPASPCTGQLDPGTFTLNVPPVNYTLTVNESGNGSVTQSPDSATYTAGSQVVLTAAPLSGYQFSSWSGDVSATTNPLTVTMTTNMNVTANFIAASSQISPDGSTLNAGAVGSLITGAGTWTFNPSLMGGGGDVILLNGTSASGGSAGMLLVYNKGKLYAKANNGAWWVWATAGWSAVGGDPRTPPTVPGNLSANAASATQINLNWNASTSTIGVAGYKIFRNGTQVATSTGVSYADTGLTASTTYSYAISAYDTENISSAQSGAVSAQTFSGTLSPDGSTLSPGMIANLLTPAGVWTFSPSVGGGGSAVLLNGKSAAGGSAVLLVVDNGGKVYAESSGGAWWIWNGSGWSAASGDPRGASTPPATTPPTVPGNLQATVISPSQINLSWNASTSAVGIGGYKIFRNGTQVATSTGVTYSDTGLTISTTYSYTVSAYDLNGNSSAQSSVVTAQTQAGSSSSAPSADGSALNAGSGANLVTAAGTWTFSSSTGGGGNDILLNSASAAGGSAVMLLVYNSGKLYAKTNTGAWWLWTGSGWSSVSEDPRTPPVVVSPDGSTLSPGMIASLSTTAGTWTFSPSVGSGGSGVLLNGKSAAGGSAVLLVVENSGKLYAESNGSSWWLWSGSGWSAASGDPR